MTSALLTHSYAGLSTLTGGRPGRSTSGDAALPGSLTRPKPSGAALSPASTGPSAMVGTAFKTRLDGGTRLGWLDPKGSRGVCEHMPTTRTTARTAVGATP
ncbi:hypothetical protein [Nonomuraea fuscirosea]|uniref:hypothetical protein n=1 Tax=Nonomuraea fuscirosea TaxID=1291556 RepID=UPI00342C7B2A